MRWRLHPAVSSIFFEKLVVVEVKSIHRFERVHSAQMLCYLRLSGRKVGLLINFNVKWLVEDGIKRRSTSAA